MKHLWTSADSDKLFEAVLHLKSIEECEHFFRDILTLKELETIVVRYKIARMLTQKQPKSYLEIAKEVGTSTTTVTRVAHWVKAGAGGYHLIMKKAKH